MSFMNFVLRDGRKAVVKITAIEYATAWKLARDTSLVITVPVIDGEGNVERIPITDFEKLRINGFATQRKAV